MRIFLACLCCAVATAGLAARAPAGKAFSALLDEAMARMHRGMASAERIGLARGLPPDAKFTLEVAQGEAAPFRNVLPLATFRTNAEGAGQAQALGPIPQILSADGPPAPYPVGEGLDGDVVLLEALPRLGLVDDLAGRLPLDDVGAQPAGDVRGVPGHVDRRLALLVGDPLPARVAPDPHRQPLRLRFL